MAVLAGSVIVALIATVVLRLHNRGYRRICEARAADSDHNSVPDTFETHR